MSTEGLQTQTSVGVSQTGLGYRYVRCRANGDDSTVYIHQLTACVDHDPRDVFSPRYDVHHRIPIPWLNIPGNLELQPAYDHRAEAPHDPPVVEEVLAE